MEGLYMKNRKIGKMASTLIVLFLIASGFMVMQCNTRPVEAVEIGSTGEGYTINGILDSKGEVNIPEDTELDIKLRDLSTGSVKEEKTRGNYYEFANVKTGYYEVILPSQYQAGVSNWRSTSEVIEVDGSKDVVREDLEVDTKSHQEKPLEVNVTAYGEPVFNASITIEKRENNRKVFSHTVDEALKNENATVYEIDVYDDFDGILRVEKEGYSPYIEENVSTYIEDDVKVEAELETGTRISGRLEDEEGRLVTTDMNITLYNEEIGMFTKSTVGPSFSIRAPEGDLENYLLIVNAKGYKPFVTDGVTVDIGEHSVSEEEPEKFDIGLEFENDKLIVTTNRTLRASTALENLDYTYLGHLALQLDMVLAEDHDYDLSEQEEAVIERLEYTQKTPLTNEFVTIDGEAYELVDDEVSSEFIDDGGLFDTVPMEIDGLASEIKFRTEVKYQHIGDGITEESHDLDLLVRNIHVFGNEREFEYNVSLPDGYERTEHQIVSGEDVEVEGYPDFRIFPHEGEMDDLTHLNFEIIQSEESEVELMIEDQEWIKEMEYDEFGYDYVIRKGQEATITAEYESETSSPVSYEWRWTDDKQGDGEYDYPEETIEITLKFEEVKEAEDFEFTVRDTAGFDPTDSLTINVNDQGPEGEYVLVDEEEVSIGEFAYVNESDEVEFSAEDFSDESTGEITEYSWYFGEENEATGENVTHEFEVPGVYEMTLNVTDGVGNEESYSIEVIVDDITEPVGDFTIEWDEEISQEAFVSIPRDEEAMNVTFNATGLPPHDEEYEHPDYGYEITDYHWTIEGLDITGEGGKWYHDFVDVEAGEYPVILNVTDAAGNTRTIEKTIEIERGPVPDLTVTEMSFSEDSVRAGDTVDIIVNVTNLGDADAENVITELEVDDEIVDINKVLYDEHGNELTNETIESDGIASIEFEWEPEDEGDKSVLVRVYDQEEPEDLIDDGNEMRQDFTVDQPAWREYLVYALIPIIIIGVTVGLYFYKDKIGRILG